jgi:hypothetical protein
MLLTDLIPRLLGRVLQLRLVRSQPGQLVRALPGRRALGLRRRRLARPHGVGRREADAPARALIGGGDACFLCLVLLFLFLFCVWLFYCEC